MSVWVLAAILLAVLLGMLAELLVSRSNERIYRQLGAVEAADPVYAVMRWAYPGVFILMAAEGAISGPATGWLLWTGVGLFAASKLLKVWAIRSLGYRWTYRVLVMPSLPLVSSGPYAVLRHPNYVAVLGELAGMALMTHALITGPTGTLFFAELLRRRIGAEERALALELPKVPGATRSGAQSR